MSLGTDAARAERCCLHKTDQGLKRSERLKKPILFKKLFKEGSYFRNKEFSVRVLKNDLTISRLGISVRSKTFPKAVQRNAVKRLIRDVFRKNKRHLVAGCDILIRPKIKTVTKLEYNSFKERMLELLGAAGLLSKE
jgi:ribonuclease P protein component